jgi:excisionase family DNA binding protein
VACEVCGCPEARWLSTEAVAEQLVCSQRTVRRMIQRGDVDGVRLRGKWRVDHESLDDYVSRDSVRHYVPTGVHCETNRSVT